MIFASFAAVGPTSASSRSVTLSPATGIQAGQVVTVSWSGFTPGPVYLYQCMNGAVRWSQCAEVTYVKGMTNDNGTGSVSFPIWRGVPLPQMPVVGTRNFAIACNASNPCNVVVTECPFDIDADRAASAPIKYAPGGTNPDVTTTTKFETTTTTTPNLPPTEAEPISTAYSSSLHLLMTDMKYRALDQPFGVNIDLLTQNSPNAVEQFVSGSTEVAIGALGPNEEQLAELSEQKRDVAYVPIAISALTIGQKLLVNGILSEQLNISAESLSRLYHSPEQGDNWTQLSDYNDSSLVAENGGCGIQIDGRRYPVASFRADASNANLLFTTYLNANAPSWELGAGLNLPINDSQVYGRPSPEDLAKFIAFGDLAIDHATNSSAGRIGFVDRSYARAFGLTEAGVRNGAGEFVRPTDEAILTAIEASYEPGTFFFADVASAERGAYPLPIVYYAIVQTNLTETFTAENAADLKEFLHLIISPAGQQRAAELGFVPLPQSMRDEAAAAIEKIGTTSGSEPPPPPAINPTPVAEPLELEYQYDYTLADDFYTGDELSPGSYGSEGTADLGGAADAEGTNASEDETADVAVPATAPIRSVLTASPPLISLPVLLVLGLAAALAGQVMKRSTPGKLR